MEGDRNVLFAAFYLGKSLNFSHTEFQIQLQSLLTDCAAGDLLEP